MTDAAERLSHHVTTTAGAAQYPEERVTNAVEALVLHLDLTHEQEDAALPFIEALLEAGAAEEVERIRGNIRAVQPVKPGWGYWSGVFLAILDAPGEES